jgi:ribokinase
MSGSRAAGGVLVTGSSNTDLVCLTDRLPRPGETVASYAFSTYAGGKAANQAVAAARSGAQVTFVGAFGDDAYGIQRRSDLAADGVDLRFSRTLAGTPSGLALIAVDRRGENLIVTVGGANELIEGTQIAEALELFRPQVILLPNEAPADVLDCALAHASATRILNAAPFDPNLDARLANVDILICNEVEAAGFLGFDVSIDNAEEAVKALASRACPQAIITLGPAGAIGFDGLRAVTAPARQVQVVDTTGAGDAFCGAFAAWLVAGATFEESLRAGVVAGSLAATNQGAQPALPREDQIRAAL